MRKEFIAKDSPDTLRGGDDLARNPTSSQTECFDPRHPTHASGFVTILSDASGRVWALRCSLGEGSVIGV